MSMRNARYIVQAEIYGTDISLYRHNVSDSISFNHLNLIRIYPNILRTTSVPPYISYAVRGPNAAYKCHLQLYFIMNSG